MNLLKHLSIKYCFEILYQIFFFFIKIVEDVQKDSFLERVILDFSENMEVLLLVKEYRKLSTTNYPCISDEHYSKSKVCILLHKFTEK